ncbi:MAG: CRISPR system precrRNA processing endoribonuclease RAMP protein Cas6 [Aestuariivita sp.]|nr:CRISPR system precrRNA processing endoribonuclease RAMP protein Cas6 [Aestuariivita sp.]
MRKSLTKDSSEIEETLLSLTHRVKICAFRILLRTGKVRATIPMLRGVWGATLKNFEPVVYRTIFEGYRSINASEKGRFKLPLYILRPAHPDPDFAPAVELIFLGNACYHATVAIKAFRQAVVNGLGPRRTICDIQEIRRIYPSETLTDKIVISDLGCSAQMFIQTTPRNHGLRLNFYVPLRLLRRKQLIHSPNFTDIIAISLERLYALSCMNIHKDFKDHILNIAHSTPAFAWIGQRQDLIRWSGRQKTLLELRGIVGYLDLPNGAGPFRPLLAASEWMHIGKGTVFGLGQLNLTKR